MQLGLLLGDLFVAGLEQLAAGEHRVRLGDLAAEELDREAHGQLRLLGQAGCEPGFGRPGPGTPEREGL